MRQVCPRCDGSLVAERDQYGAHVRCVVCGWYQDTELIYNPKLRKGSPKKNYVEVGPS